MFVKKFKCSCLTIGGLSAAMAGGFLMGKSYEKSRNCDLYSRSDVPSYFENVPALPVFSTVSAAELSPVEKFPAPDFSHSGDKIGRTSQIMKYGFPGLDNVRSFQDFVLSYDQRNRIAHWVFEHLRSDRLTKNENIDRQKCDFKEDQSIHAFFRL